MEDDKDTAKGESLCILRLHILVGSQAHEAYRRIETGQEDSDDAASNGEEKKGRAEWIKRHTFRKVVTEERHDRTEERHGDDDG